MIGKNLFTHMAAGVAALMVCITNPASAQVTFEWATVGNPGNAEDPLNSPGGPCEPDCIPGIGTVGYVYRIAKHEVTNDQYAEFLNAVATTDTNGLYNANMGSDPRGGITQSGSAPNFTYAFKLNMGDKPVIRVSFVDAMRFVNWLHNGQPTGAQEATTTESGGYDIFDESTETRAPDAQFFIPTENEWYKAAYYDPRTEAAGGPPGDDHYWRYPTASDSFPMIATASATGDISNPGCNVANYDHGADWNGQDGNVTTVGSAGACSESFFETSDQGGNVYEWTETFWPGSERVLRGGSWLTDENDLRSSFRNHGGPSADGDHIGFRVASPLGACCKHDGTCDDAVTEAECRKVLVGAYQGNGTVCLGDNDGSGLDDILTGA